MGNKPKNELDKHIMELFSVLYRGTEADLFINLGESIKGKVDEARKAFPRRYCIAHPPGFGDEEQFEREDFADEVVEWFDRYFGISTYQRGYWKKGCL
jgi:hypothetical protein